MVPIKNLVPIIQAAEAPDYWVSDNNAKVWRSGY